MTVYNRNCVQHSNYTVIIAFIVFQCEITIRDVAKYQSHKYKYKYLKLTIKYNLSTCSS